MVKNRLCHWGPIAALTIITFLFCVSTLTFIIWCPPTDTVAIVHSFIFMFWVISIFRNFFKAMYLGPGHVPFRWKPVSSSKFSILFWVKLQSWNIFLVSELKILLLNPSRPNPGRREKIKLNFYFHTSLWCLKRFYEGLKKGFFCC